jgi:hypothetical protein
MIPHQFFYLMVVLGLLWIFFMLHLAWPSPCPATPQRPAEPSLPRRPRSSEPKAFTGLTHKPQCVACEQAPPAPPVTAPAAPPPRITSTRGRKRQVDTRHHFCAYRKFKRYFTTDHCCFGGVYFPPTPVERAPNGLGVSCGPRRRGTCVLCMDRGAAGPSASRPC